MRHLLILVIEAICLLGCLESSDSSVQELPKKDAISDLKQKENEEHLALSTKEREDSIYNYIETNFKKWVADSFYYVKSNYRKSNPSMDSSSIDLFQDSTSFIFYSVITENVTTNYTFKNDITARTVGMLEWNDVKLPLEYQISIKYEEWYYPDLALIWNCIYGYEEILVDDKKTKTEYSLSKGNLTGAYEIGYYEKDGKFHTYESPREIGYLL